MTVELCLVKTIEWRLVNTNLIHIDKISFASVISGQIPGMIYIYACSQFSPCFNRMHV